MVTWEKPQEDRCSIEKTTGRSGGHLKTTGISDGAKYLNIGWSGDHENSPETIVNLNFESKSEHTLDNYDEGLIKGVPRHPKDSIKRTPWNDHELIKKSIKTGVNLEFSSRSWSWCLSGEFTRISPQMYSLKLQPWIPQENPSPKDLKHNKPKIMQESQNLREKLEGGESNMVAKKISHEAQNEHTT